MAGARDFTTAYRNAIEAPNVNPAVFYEGKFRTGYVRLWTGIGPKDMDGKTFDGAGDFLSFSEIEETADITANGIVVGLSGPQDANVALALNEGQRRLPGSIWLALMDDDNELIEAPRLMFTGKMDSMVLDDQDVASPTIRVSYEHELIDLERPRLLRYTDEEQKRLFPDDRGLEFIESLQDLETRWGSEG